MRAFQIGLWLLAGILAACGGSKQEDPAAAPAKDSVFGDLVRTEDKARGVEATLQKDKEATDAALEANEAAAAK